MIRLDQARAFALRAQRGVPLIADERTFDLLLTRLDTDRDRAGEKYEAIRAKLIKIFECRGCWKPDELADETIDRVARKLAEGAEIWGKDPGPYFHGVALRVLHEFWAQPQNAAMSLGSREFAGAGGSDCDGRLRDLLRCLARLPTQERKCILEYYRGEKRDKIQIRKKLAEHLGISQNALRIHVHHIRERLEACVAGSRNRSGSSPY